MQAYLARRLLALVPALFFASLIVFVIVRLVPGSIIDMMLAQNDVGADKLSRDQLVATLGLDRPMWLQYFSWIGGILLHGDFSLRERTEVRVNRTSTRAVDPLRVAKISIDDARSLNKRSLVW